MIIQKIRDELDDNAVVFDNPSFDRSIIGTTEEGGAVYMYDDMVHELMDDDDMTEEDANDFIMYNTVRSLPYMYTYGIPPIIIYPLMN